MVSPSEKKSDDNNEEDESEYVKVYLRLRPMNKLEESKRSKDCIELHDNPKIVTVDSPLQGLFDFTFDMVFDEYASQEEVYREGLSSVPQKLMEGINCAVMAYGQTGTGKSHTMLGEANGGEMNARAKDEQDMNPEVSQDLEITEGMIARVVRDVFAKIQKLPPSVEVNVRCSYVEIYLEQIRDLLTPGRKGIRVGGGQDGEFCLLGASELCCLNPKDVYTLLARGNAFRTASATEQNLDLRKSHGIFSLQINQTNHETSTHKRSILYMLDMAGNEAGRTKSSRQLDNSVSMESRMVSASLQSVYTYIRAKLVEQGKEKGRIHPNAYANVSKLARLLKPCFGGNFFTTVFCTASPSSYNIDNTIATIRFGQKVRLLRNTPTPCDELAVEQFRAKLSKSERRVTNLTRFVKILAQESRILRKTGRVRQPHSSRVWDAISRIAKSGEDDDGSDLTIQIYKKGEITSAEKQEMDDAAMEAKLKEVTAAKEKAENSTREYHSEIMTLKAQLEVANQERQRLDRELNKAKEEIETNNSRKTDMESRLRTSQYRENEAVVFLRQFRSFYLRLLKTKATQGNGTTAQIIDETLSKVPGAPNLGKLMDIDKLMVESGLIEEAEVGEDSNQPGYSPSDDAAAKSSEQAEKAQSRELGLMTEMTGASESVLRALEPGQFTVYRQKLVLTPAGKLAVKQERELEREVLELSHKVVSLQNAVNAEKAMVEALSARQGALGKMKSAQEMNVLKTELERKSNDLQAIVWKMNELHLVNKTIDEKLENRDNHIMYIEESLAKLQQQNRKLEEDQSDNHKKLREESAGLKQQLDGMTLKMWQLGEATPEMSDIWRFTIPCGGEPAEPPEPANQQLSKSRHDKRHSIGTVAEDTITLLENPEKPHRNSASTQTENSAETTESTTQTEIDTAEMSIQTDEPSRLNSEAVEISTQTENAEMTSVEVQTEASETIEKEIQTVDPYPENQEMPEKPECAEVEVQTEGDFKPAVEGEEIGIQTDGDFKPAVEGKEIAIQTDEIETPTAPTVSEMSTQTEKENEPPKAEMTETAVQTEVEDEPVPPNEIALLKSESTASLQLTQHELPVSSKHDADSIKRSEHRGRPPKPRSFDSAHSSKFAAADEDDDSSIQLQNSVSSMTSFGMQSMTDVNSPYEPSNRKGPTAPHTPSDNNQARLGQSMSALHGHNNATVDWREKMRQQGKGTAATPQPQIKEKAGSKAAMPRAPFAQTGMMSQQIKNSGPSPTSKKKKAAFQKNADSKPEWLSKYQEMGIKGDINEEKSMATSQRFRPPKTSNKMPNKAKSMMNINANSKSSGKADSTPEFLSRFKSMGIKADENDPDPEPKQVVPPPIVDSTPEFLSKFKSMGLKADENEPEPEPEVTPPPPVVEDNEPEWKKQFKKIGMKGEEVIVEGPPPPEKKEKAPPAPPPKKTPEWMMKFKQMGIDGGEAK